MHTIMLWSDFLQEPQKLGVLKEGFIEVWRDNGSVRYLCDPLLTNIGLRIRDFYPDEAWRIADIPDGDIPINGTIFMNTWRQPSLRLP
ncbi:hypothetical protein V1522DRAFT_414774 [Lipomyces starkeyi]